VTTYKVAIEGTYDGKDQTGTYNAGSVWKKNKGGWQAIFHTNVKQAPAGG
jgi:ketosteroid isomerase-like protein